MTLSSATLQLLATPHLVVGGQRHLLPPSAPGLLVACLAVLGAPVSRERVAALFWPEADEGRAQHHLRVTLHRSRQWLDEHGAGDGLQADRHRLQLVLGHDVGAFRAAVGRADWGRAHALHQAPLLDGLSVRSLGTLDDWFRDERESLRALWRDAARREAARLADAGQPADAAVVLLRLLQDDLLAEDMLQALLRVAADAGQRSLALDLHDRFCQLAQRELGLSPMRETVALADALRQRVDRPARPVPVPIGQPPAALSRPPLVGRQAERAELAQAGVRLLVLAGEPGVGKTRLLQECGSTAMWWRCRQGLRTVPLLPVAEALQLELPRVRASVDDAASLQELARLLPALAPGEVLPPADGTSPRLLTTLAAVLPRLCDAIVVDDLQWADTGTLQLLRLLLDRTGLSLRASLRSADAPRPVTRWLDDERTNGRLRELKLAPLPAADTAQLLASLAGQQAPRLAGWLQRATGGNPFFALETLRTMFETGQLRVTDGGWARPLDDAGADFQAPQVPPRVAALVQRRLDDLPESTRRVVLAAAVAGDAVQQDLLAQSLGLSPWAVAEALARAQLAGLLDGPVFVHDLAREAVLSSAAPDLQRALHASLVHHDASRLGPHRRAAHAWAAGLAPEAVEATLAAAVNDRALGLLEQAQSLLADAQQRTSDPTLRARLEVERAQCAESAARYDEAEAHVQAVLDATDDIRLRALALSVRVIVLHNQGRLNPARSLAAQIEALDPDWPDRHTTAAKLAYAAGDFAQALGRMQDQVAMLRGQGASADLAAALSGLATAMAGQGRLAEALPLHQEAVALAQRFKARHFQVYATSNYLWTAARLDSGHAEAAALGHAALALGEYEGSTRLRVNLAGVLQRLGQLDQAAALYLQQAHDDRDPTVSAVCWARWVDSRLLAGDRSGVPDAIEQALSLLPRTDAPVAQAAIVTVALEQGDAEQVQRALAAWQDWPLPVDQRQRLLAARRRHLPSADA